MIAFRHLWVGGFGIRYDFERAGEGLAEHTHDRTTAHTVEVHAGAVRVVVDGRATDVTAGCCLAFDWSRPHEVVALEDETRIVNRFIFGQPEEYKALPPEELAGSFESRIRSRQK